MLDYVTLRTRGLEAAKAYFEMVPTGILLEFVFASVAPDPPHPQNQEQIHAE